MLYHLTRSELKSKKASEFVEGDIIRTGNYIIFIHYMSSDGTRYDTPALCSYHTRKNCVPCGCTPGVDRPYYVDDFINR